MLRLASKVAKAFSTSCHRHVIMNSLGRNSTARVKRLKTASSMELSRGSDRKLLTYDINDVISGYKLLEVSDIEGKHEKTGSKHLHLDCTDTNNVFMITFKTPGESTGVTHVLEHTTLCGSEKYPIRDPFFNMIRRSMQTFMNAWTAPDQTSFPFSTQNAKDFDNLLSVYLDAVYFPLLTYEDFLQEGHRLEFEIIDDPQSPLVRKGIVLNEMKGGMLSRHLFPTTTYGQNSGGDPELIPKLTWDNLRNYHQQHYHPSNSYTCTYGDLPLSNHLTMINNVISRFNKEVPTPQIKDEVRYQKPIFCEANCPPPPPGAPSRQGKVSVAFLLNHNVDVFTTSSMILLSNLLMQGANSPMYKTLLEAQPTLGSNYSPSSGYEHRLRETFFSIGLQGIAEEDTHKVVDVIMSTLQKSAKEGFPMSRVESFLHQVELGQRHVTTDFGLNTLSEVVSSWVHGGSPIESLAVPQIISQLRAKINEGPFLQNLIQTYFLDNPHRVVLFMKPARDQKEKEELTNIKNSLTEEDVNKIIEESINLEERQDQVQDPSVLPKITLQDISKAIPNTSSIKMDYATIPATHKTSSVTIPIQFSPQPTNELVYFRALLNMNSLPEHLVSYVPLFCDVMSALGGATMDFRQMSDKIQQYTGGLVTEPTLRLHPSDSSQFGANILVYSFCMAKNVHEMMKLWEEIFHGHSQWSNNKDRLKTLLLTYESNFQETLVDNGSELARLVASSDYSLANTIEEKWDGMTQFKLLQKLVTGHPTVNQQQSEGPDLDQLVAIMQEIATHVMTNNVSIAVNTQEQFYESPAKPADGARHNILKFLSSLPSPPVTSSLSHNWTHPKSALSPKNIGLSTKHTYIGSPATQVNNASLCFFPKIPYTHPHFTTLQVIAHLLTNTFLHREVREKGGAYGAGAFLHNGVFSLYSYRDPNLFETFEAFQEGLAAIINNQFTEDNIEEAKLNVFANTDKPVAPYYSGITQFLRGITDEMRQSLFSIGRNDIISVANSYLSKDNNSTMGVFGSMANKELISQQTTWTYQE